METTRPSLLARIRDLDDASAWSEFDSIYRPILQRFARLQKLSEEEAEEVTQECMATLARKAPEFRYDPQRGRFRAWLFTLISNQVRNLRRDEREITVNDECLDTLPSSEPSPEEAFDLIWAQEHLNYCLTCLRHEVAEATYTAFDLHVMQDLDVQTVCERLSISPSRLYTIKWRLSQKLAEKMQAVLSFW